jgi:hypothetical protein
MRTVSQFWGAEEVRGMSAREMNNVLRQAWQAQGELFDASAARRWATNEAGVEFQFTEDMLLRDAAEFKELNGDLALLAQRRQQALGEGRLCGERVRACGLSTDDIDMVRAIKIAEEGMQLFTAEDFQPCAVPPPLRQIYLEAAPAVNKLMADMWREGKLLLLPTELVRTVPGVHFSPMSWAPKADKKEGRPIGDLSSPQGKAVNAPAAVELVREAWGPIVLPTIQDIVAMILEAADEFGWEAIELWKMDLKGAFTLLNFRAIDAKWLAFELTEGLTAVHIVGMFGWCGCPFGFAVFSRVLIDLVNRCTGRRGLMYVDDVCMAGPIATGEKDRRMASQTIEGVMGPGSVAPAKTEKGRVLTMLGWALDLNVRVVSLSLKNLYKTLFAFFSLDIAAPVTLPVLQALASRASRAALLSWAMKPFTRGMFGCMKFYGGNRSSRRKLSADARFEILLWRAFLIQLAWKPEIFARPLESFRTRSADILLEFDASLEGLGVQLSRQRGDGEFVPWVHWGGAHPLGEQGRLPAGSGFQNCFEFAAILAGLLVLRQLGVRNCAVEVRGDNVASLSWLRKGRAASIYARKVSIGVSLLLAHMGAHVASTIHVPGEENWQMDGLSRGKNSLEVGLDPAQFSPAMFQGGWPWKFLEECSPLKDQGDVQVVRKVVELLREPLTAHSEPSATSC